MVSKMSSEYKQWAEEYAEELEHMYEAYLDHGRAHGVDRAGGRAAVAWKGFFG